MNPNEINGFELFGYDIMLDKDLNTYLIEVNTNPWLETPSSLLSTMISSVLNHTFRVVIDPLFPNPNPNLSLKNCAYVDNLNVMSKFELIFDSKSMSEF